MFKSKVLLDIMTLPPAPKVMAYRGIIVCLTNNPYFPTPDVPLTELSLLLGKFETSILRAADGSHTAKAEMHSNELLADTAFRNEAAYVQRISNGDEAKILSSGYGASKPHAAHHKAPLTALDGPNSGSLKLVGLPYEKAGSYDWQMYQGDFPENEAGWVTIGRSTAAHFEVTGLTPLTKYYFRYCAVTTQGVTDYCQPILKFVL